MTLIVIFSESGLGMRQDLFPLGERKGGRGRKEINLCSDDVPTAKQ